MRAFEILTEAKNKPKQIKARDPNWRDMEALRKSGAAGSHGDKTKLIPRKEKHKSMPMEATVGRELQHAEDLVIVDGSKGAMSALEQLESMAEKVDDVTIKWDGSPALYFGRDESGEFILTDKSGFLAKGYDGKAKSGKDLEKMLLGRKMKDPSPEKEADRKVFAKQMGDMFNEFESIVDDDFRGFVFGDLLYKNTPTKDGDGEYVFTPNTVTYNIPQDSDLGKRIGNTKAGIVVHHYKTLDGQEMPIKGAVKGINTNGNVLVVGPTTVTEPPKVDTQSIETARSFIKSNAAAIDALLDDAKLAEMKISDFKNILYNFVNQQVKTRDLSNLDARFLKWLQGSKVSTVKQGKIEELRQQQPKAFAAIFDALEMIMKVKDDIIDQLDMTSSVKASIGGKRGGEGYVKGKMKLVPRKHFSAANVEKHS